MYAKRLSWLANEDFQKISSRVYDRIFSACTFKKRSGIYKKTPLLTMLLNNDGQFFREYLKLFKNNSNSLIDQLDRGEMEFLLRGLYSLINKDNFEQIDFIALEQDEKKYTSDFINRGRDFVSSLKIKYAWPDLSTLYDEKDKLIKEKREEFIDWLKTLNFDTLKLYLWIPKYDNGQAKKNDNNSRNAKVNYKNSDIQGTLPF